MDDPSDKFLKIMPAAGPVTPSQLFVCTLVASIGGNTMSFPDLTNLVCNRPHPQLLAVNSNFGHSCQPGYENLLKHVKPPSAKKLVKGKPRKFQGDGTYFQSAIELIFRINHPDVDPGKIYKVKFFPTTGETQIPGVILPDLKDGDIVLSLFVDYLSSVLESPVVIHSSNPNMLNYKFCVICKSPRVLIDTVALTNYMIAMEKLKICSANPIKSVELEGHGWVVIIPPYPIRETVPPFHGNKVSFLMEGEKREPRINIFGSGKINILGSDTMEFADLIYNFFVELFTANWNKLIAVTPRKDADRLCAASAPTEIPAQIEVDPFAQLIDDFMA
jgi:hypothetical protein